MTQSGTERTALYRFFGGDGQLLYVGITDRPGRRWETHMRRKPWWLDVQRQELEWHPDRETAMAAEVAAILNECPRYNLRHSTTGPKTFELASAWTCPLCGWETTHPLELVQHIETEARGKAKRRLPPGSADRLAVDAVKLQRALARAAEVLSSAQAVLNEMPARTQRQRTPSPPLSASDAEKLMTDLDTVLGTARVRLSDLPARLRSLAPDFEPYRRLTGLKIREVLRARGVRVTNSGNVLRLDPADFRQRVVMSRGKGY